MQSVGDMPVAAAQLFELCGNVRASSPPLFGCYAPCMQPSKREMIMEHRNIYRRHSTKALGAALIASLLTGGAAFAAGGTTMLSGTPHASVIAFNQKAKGDAVTITYAFLPQDGTLDIYALDSSGKISAAPLGKVSLKAGDHRDVKVTLNSSPKQGMRLQAVIENSGQPLKYSGDIPERTFKVL